VPCPCSNHPGSLRCHAAAQALPRCQGGGTGRALGSAPASLSYGRAQAGQAQLHGERCLLTPSPEFRPRSRTCLGREVPEAVPSSWAARPPHRAPVCRGQARLLAALSAHLCKNMLHLSLLVPEALYLLRDPGVLLQLLQSCPLTVEVGAAKEKNKKNQQNMTKEAFGPDPIRHADQQGSPRTPSRRLAR